MTRSKEIRRIENAIKHRNEAELRWALGQCEIRRKYLKARSSLWYHIERRIRAALKELDVEAS